MFSVFLQSSEPLPKVAAPFAKPQICNKKPLKSHDFKGFGGGRWIRTTEVTDNRFTVCPLWPLGNSPIFDWSWWTDSNPRPADYKSAALPTELHQHGIALPFVPQLDYLSRCRAVCQGFFSRFSQFFSIPLTSLAGADRIALLSFDFMEGSPCCTRLCKTAGRVS